MAAVSVFVGWAAGASPLLAQHSLPVAFTEMRCSDSARAATLESAEPARHANPTPPVLKSPQPEPELGPYYIGTHRPLRTTLQFVVDSFGEIAPCGVTLLREDDRAWTVAVLEVLRHYRFQPGQLNGVAVPVLAQETWVRRVSADSGR